MSYEVHCPNCGEFKERKRPKTCPRCGSDQIITLHERHDIVDRFRWERDNARAVADRQSSIFNRR